VGDVQGGVPAGRRRPDLPNYSLSEITAHRTAETGVWVTFGEGVYDITDFMVGHPGGDKISLAAGGSVEPFWDLYAIHQTEHVYAVLETLRVGNIDPADVATVAPSASGDLYSHEPRRHPALRVSVATFLGFEKQKMYTQFRDYRDRSESDHKQMLAFSSGSVHPWGTGN